METLPSHRRPLSRIVILLVSFSFIIVAQTEKPRSNPPVYIAFLWHMHQPIYFPYESVVQTDANARYPYSVKDIHTSRTGPYTTWPKDAIAKGLDLDHLGAQVSFSGSLMENLNALEANGAANFANWKSSWITARTWKTSLNNPRLDMVGFGYHHPLMALLDDADIRKQVQAHKKMLIDNFGGTYSKGIFPPEDAFSPRMIPALADEGFQWVIVDNVHFDRAAKNYPFSTSGNLVEPNKADQVNVDPNDWVQLNGLWAPTKNSAAWGRRPHYVQYVDPSSGNSKKIIAVPADRYAGNEDGRGGFGALNYETVLSQLESANTDPAHPIIVLLHHDGDNYGGGSDGYYGANFQSFVNWLKANPTRFVCTTVQDYLDQFPPAADDIIHIEDGSWSGADNGDPEFKKWNGDPSAGYSPDRNSWSVITAAKNDLLTKDYASSDAASVLDGWKFMMNAEASDYWYWDGSQNGIWDAHPTRGANLAVTALKNFPGLVVDQIGPTIFLPQREPFNPGGTEWTIAQTSDMAVWTFIHDVSGVKRAELKYRTDMDGVNPLASIQNETYAGGAEVSAWSTMTMDSISPPSKTDPAPLLKAKEYSAVLSGLKEKLIDYYVEAEDMLGNISRSPIQHVWIGSNTGSGGGGGTGNPSVSWTPASPTNHDSIHISIRHITKAGKLHWGVNHSGSVWLTPDAVYRPAGSVLFNSSGPAVQTPMTLNAADSTLTLTIGPFDRPEQIVTSVAFVFNFADNSWDNNGGQDYHLNFGSTDTSTVVPFVMDGAVDKSAVTVAGSGASAIYASFNGNNLYIAASAAPSQGGDVFLFVTDSLRPLKNAPWAKAGQVSGWSMVLANESSNNYSGWFDKNGSGVSFPNKSGSIVEGTIPLKTIFGNVPPQIYLALGKYQTNDGGTLVVQTPTGNGDGSIGPAEWSVYTYGVSSVQRRNDTPLSFGLGQNYPNPFNPSTTIPFTVMNGKEHTRITVYDLLGRSIATLVDEQLAAGSYTVPWNASDRASGSYIVRMNTGGLSSVRRVVLVK